jgi:hypothetical protein
VGGCLLVTSPKDEMELMGLPLHCEHLPEPMP